MCLEEEEGKRDNLECVWRAISRAGKGVDNRSNKGARSVASDRHGAVSNQAIIAFRDEVEFEACLKNSVVGSVGWVFGRWH